MSGRPAEPLYLQRRSYRMRRVIDACRLLPFLGGLLWLIPLLWPQGGEAAFPTSRAVLYMFGVWAVLIALGALISSWLPRGEEAEDSAASPAAPVRRAEDAP